MIPRAFSLVTTAPGVKLLDREINDPVGVDDTLNASGSGFLT